MGLREPPGGRAREEEQMSHRCSATVGAVIAAVTLLPVLAAAQSAHTRSSTPGHEGNYGLTGILAGSRAEEAAAADAAQR